MCEQIKEVLEDAWKKFCVYYREKATTYQKNWRPQLNEKQNLDSHWICWNEYDLTFHIGRFFYEILSEKGFSNKEVHFEKKVDHINIDNRGYVFENKLDCLWNKLQKWPKVDMIVTQEDSCGLFLLCAEVKCFHRYEPAIHKINEDIKKLKSLKDCKIAEEVVFILFDDYFCHKRGGIVITQIQKRLNEIKSDGITVLFCTSKESIGQI